MTWYHILANPEYMREFNYYDIRDRNLYIGESHIGEMEKHEQSDMVSILLNLAYCNEEVARSFKFDQKSPCGFIRNYSEKDATIQKNLGSRLFRRIGSKIDIDFRPAEKDKSIWWVCKIHWQLTLNY